MIDQGKISELKQSSHCYQTSTSVGQKPEAYVLYKRTSERRSLQPRKLFEPISDENLQEYYPFLYARRKAEEEERQFRINRDSCYRTVERAFKAKHQIDTMNHNSGYKEEFLSIWQGTDYMPNDDIQYCISAWEPIAFMNGDLKSPCVNLEAFLDASPVETMRKAASKNSLDDTDRTDNRSVYVPQAGTVSNSCVATAKVAVKACVGDMTETSNLSLTTLISRAKDFCSCLAKNFEILDLIIGVILMYLVYRIVTDLTLLMTWMCGFATFSTWDKLNNQQPFVCYRPQCRRMRRLRKFRDMAPQAGILDSDDGAAFKGTKPKNTKPSPKKTPSKTPVTSSPSPTKEEFIPWTGMCAFGGVPRPKKDQSKHNGSLNGFGVGI